MDEIFHELGVLFVGCVPTAILFLLLLLCYTTLVHRPLSRILAQRRERTEGAVEKARAAIGRAETMTQEYEAKLRTTRQEINAGRERQIAQWNAARDRALGEAREQATARLRQAQAALAADAETSRAGMGSAIDALANEIAASVTRPGVPVADAGVRS